MAKRVKNGGGGGRNFGRNNPRRQNSTEEKGGLKKVAKKGKVMKDKTGQKTNPQLKKTTANGKSSGGSNVRDARDKLVSMAQKTDARERLQRLRNLKDGKVEVKTTSGGAITITKTTKGQTLLTTKKKELIKSNMRSETNVKRTLGRGGTLSFNTKKKTSTLVGLARSSRPQQQQQLPPQSTRAALAQVSSSSRRDHSRKSSSTPLVRTIRGTNIISEAVRLDRELMSAKMDTSLQRTVRQQQQHPAPSSSSSARHRGSSGAAYRSRDRSSPLAPYRPPGSRRDSSPYDNRMRSMRSRSPDIIDVDRYHIRSDDYGGGSGGASRKYHYDDPRSELEREAEVYRKMRQQQQQQSSSSASFDYGSGNSGGGGGGGNYASWTMGDHRKDQMGVSPLQGVKVVVSNLQSTVSQEDIVELFGDIGALKRAKMSNPGVAEVVFVNRADAQKAVEIYHNRQLDGKAMKCQLVGSGTSAGGASSNQLLVHGEFEGNGATKSSSWNQMDSYNYHRRLPADPEIGTVHKALFSCGSMV